MSTTFCTSCKSDAVSTACFPKFTMARTEKVAAIIAPTLLIVLPIWFIFLFTFPADFSAIFSKELKLDLAAFKSTLGFISDTFADFKTLSTFFIPFSAPDVSIPVSIVTLPSAIC